MIISQQHHPLYFTALSNFKIFLNFYTLLHNHSKKNKLINGSKKLCFAISLQLSQACF